MKVTISFARTFNGDWKTQLFRKNSFYIVCIQGCIFAWEITPPFLKIFYPQKLGMFTRSSTIFMGVLFPELKKKCWPKSIKAKFLWDLTWPQGRFVNFKNLSPKNLHFVKFWKSTKNHWINQILFFLFVLSLRSCHYTLIYPSQAPLELVACWTDLSWRVER